MNWLAVCVVVFIVLSTMAGAKRGFVKTVLSFTSVLLTIVIAVLVKEPVRALVKEQTGIYASIETGVGEFVEDKAEALQAGQSSMTETVIKSLELPGLLEQALEKSNGAAVYQQSGLKNVTAYITGWLTDLAFQAVCYLISFAAVWIILRILSGILQSIVTLPVLHQLNCLAGAAGGLLIALILIWIGGIVVTAFAGTDWGRSALLLIEESPLLCFLYNNNYLMNVLLKTISR